MAQPLQLNLLIHANGDQLTATVNGANQQLHQLGQTGQQAGHSINAGLSASTASAGLLTAGIRSVAAAFAPLLAMASLSVLANDVLKVNREFQSLKASLVNTTGSLTNSALAFDFIKDFAKSTPYDVAQVTESFIQLANMGLKPSEEALRSYGNTAASQGKPLKQMIEAVSDAATGEFERLKDFGIKASQANDKVTFSFRGTKTVVDDNAKSIQDYLIKLGNSTFGDAMALQAKTMNGAISNLGDTWDQFMDNLLQDTQENLIAKWVTKAGNAIHWLDLALNGAITKADKLAEIDRNIAAKTASIAAHNTNGAIGSMVDDFAGYDVSLEKNRLAESQQQRVKLVEAMAREKTAADLLLNSLDKETDSTDKSTKAHGHKKQAVSETEKATKSLADEYLRLAAALEREVALNGDTTRSTAMEYDLQHTQLNGLNEAQALHLLQLSAELDNRDKITARHTAAETAMQGLIDKYQQLTLSAKDYFLWSQQPKPKLTPEQTTQQALGSQFDKNTAAETAKTQTDAAKSSLDSYVSSLSTAKSAMSDLGNVSSTVLDGSISGVSTLVGAFANLSDSLGKNTAQMTEMNNKQILNAQLKDQGAISYEAYAKNALILDQKQHDLTQEKTVLELDGARQIAGAAAKLFGEKTVAAKAFHAVEMGLSVASLAMKASEMAANIPLTLSNIAAGASAMFAQGGFAGFAGVAAMMAVMAGLGLAAFGGGSNATAPVSSPSTGTVLGDSSKPSESIDHLVSTLKDIHASEYKELRGINDGVNSLSAALTGTINRLYQSGGLALTSKGSLDYGIGDRLSHSLTTFSGLLTTVLFGFLGSLFSGGYKSVQAMGIQTDKQTIGDLDTKEFQARQYTVIKTREWDLFSDSTRYDTYFNALDSSVVKALGKVFNSAGKLSIDLASKLGVDFEQKVKDYVIPALQIDMTGMNAEDANKKLSAVISTALDTMSSTIFGEVLGQYQQVGEGMFETAARVATEIVVVKDALAQTGHVITGDAAAIIAASDGLTQLAGGLKDFRQQFENFYDKFFSDTEKQARAFDTLSSALSDMYLPLPATREGFKQLASTLDINTEAGRKNYNTLLSLTDSADQYYQRLTTLKKGYEDAVTSAYSTAKSLIQAQIDGYKTLYTQLTAFAKGLTSGNLSTLSPAQKYQVATADYFALKKDIDTGTETQRATAMGKLQTVTQAFLDSSRSFNASGMGYIKDFANANAYLAENISYAKDQGDIATQQLEKLTSTVTALGLIKSSVDNVKEAVEAVNVTIAKLNGFNAANVPTLAPAKPVTVTETVKTQLTDSQVSAFKAWQLAGDNFNTHYKLAKEGNTTEKEGMKALATEYMKQTKAYVYDGTFTESQKPLVYAYYDDAVTDSLKKLGLDGSHKEGLDYVPFDGYRAELHKGERVITAQDNKLLSAKDDRALIEQLKQQNKNLEVIIKQLKASHATDGYAYQKLIDGTDKQNEKLDGMARKARLVGA
jgi:hypothetical protein